MLVFVTKSCAGKGFENLVRKMVILWWTGVIGKMLRYLESVKSRW